MNKPSTSTYLHLNTHTRHHITCYKCRQLNALCVSETPSRHLALMLSIQNSVLGIILLIHCKGKQHKPHFYSVRYILLIWGEMCAIAS